MRIATAMSCVLAVLATGASAQSLKDIIAKYTIAFCNSSSAVKRLRNFLFPVRGCC